MIDLAAIRRRTAGELEDISLNNYEADRPRLRKIAADIRALLAVAEAARPVVQDQKERWRRANLEVNYVRVLLTQDEYDALRAAMEQSK